jgi:hypothetical protein
VLDQELVLEDMDLEDHLDHSASHYANCCYVSYAVHAVDHRHQEDLEDQALEDLEDLCKPLTPQTKGFYLF